MAFDTKQFILDERKKGTPDAQIFTKLKQMNVPEVARADVASNERGFKGEILPTIGAIGGGIAGGAAGILGGPAGVYAGAVLGSGAGAALGETAQQGIEKAQGKRSSIDSAQIASTAVTNSAFEAAGIPAAKLAGKALKGVASVARGPVVKFLSHFSGYADDVIEKALTRTSGVVEGVKEGEQALVNLVKKTAKGITEFSRDALQTSKSLIKQIDKAESLGGPGQSTARTLQLQEAGNFVNSATKFLRESHNIGVNSTGELVFDRANNPSRIVAKSDQSAIQEGFKWLSSIKNNTSIRHVDSVFERLLVLKTKTPAGTPTGPQTKEIIGSYIDQAKDIARKLYPKYADVITKNLDQRIMINEAKELFGSTANPSPKEAALIGKRVLQIYNTGNLPIRQFADKVGDTVGEDITGTSAGVLLETGEQVAMRAQDLSSRRGIIQKAIEFIPRTTLKNYATTGKITGDLLKSEKLKVAAGLLGMTVEGLLREAVALSQNKTTGEPQAEPIYKKNAAGQMVKVGEKPPTQ